MSAEAPTSQPELPRRRSRVVKSNRSQIVLFSILTLILTAATVWGGRVAQFRNIDIYKLNSRIEERGLRIEQALMSFSSILIPFSSIL